MQQAVKSFGESVIVWIKKVCVRTKCADLQPV